jgi:hypothetical protein
MATKGYEVTGAPSEKDGIKGIPSREQLFDALRLGMETGGLNSFGLRLKTLAPEGSEPIIYVSLEGTHILNGVKNEFFFWAEINQLDPGDHSSFDKELEDARFIFGKLNTQKRRCSIIVGPKSFFKAPEFNFEKVVERTLV